jgi:hypothetical protein
MPLAKQSEVKSKNFRNKKEITMKSSKDANNNRPLALNKRTVKRLQVQAAVPAAGIRVQSWYSIIFLSCDGIC